MPALHYICVTAQGYAGSDKMPAADALQTDRYDSPDGLGINTQVFLDVQVGLSSYRKRPRLETYLKMPNAHLGMTRNFQ